MTKQKNKSFLGIAINLENVVLLCTEVNPEVLGKAIRR